jgi:hypothetical protein
LAKSAPAVIATPTVVEEDPVLVSDELLNIEASGKEMKQSPVFHFFTPEFIQYWSPEFISRHREKFGILKILASPFNTASSKFDVGKNHIPIRLPSDQYQRLGRRRKKSGPSTFKLWRQEEGIILELIFRSTQRHFNSLFNLPGKRGATQNRS